MRTATIRLAESRFQRGVAAAAEFPSINGDAKYTRELYSQNGIVSLLGGLLGTAGGPHPRFGPINDYNVGFDASWELDLWGKVRRQVEAADAQVDQAADQRRDALVSSLAELARDYIQLRGVQTQIRIANDNLKVDRDILQACATATAKRLCKTASMSRMPPHRSKASAPRSRHWNSRSPNTSMRSACCWISRRARCEAELGTSANPIPLAPPRIPLGIPSELARRRPDIRAAEDQLHAATANIGVAVGAFYPSVQLNGTVGLDALDFTNLWKGSSLQYMVGPSVSLPIFAGGRLKKTLELRDAQQQEAAIFYHKTVLQAWHDVVNALVAQRLEQARRARLQGAGGSFPPGAGAGPRPLH